jgi:cyclopropane-fatty-acyl-phospholipid synthase
VICTKLRLGPGSTVLDIGCGWGSFLAHANRSSGARGVGITAAREQYQAMASDPELLAISRVEAHLGDYRQLLPMTGVTAATSIGMYEHVGEDNSPAFFRLVRRSLPLGGRYLNQCIVRRTTPRRFRRDSFVERYIFPNAQLLPLSLQVADLERSGFRVVSVDAYGEHYATTIGHWIDNLERAWDECVELEGEQRVRAWRMYLMGARRRFEDRSIDLVQVLSEAR